MYLGLKSKIAIVTGGSRGIGRCCALALAREGVRVCVTARNQDLLDRVVEEVNNIGSEGYAIAIDLISLKGCQKIVDEVVTKFGGVDILVNCAGAAKGGDILDLSTELIDNALSLKTYSYLRMSQLVVPHMKKKKWGRIINIAGSAGANPTRGNIPISLANITIINIASALSNAVSKDGILVNTICPGITNTQRARELLQVMAKQERREVEEIIREIGKNLPARRIAEPEEIANIVVFLASEACSYMFGSSIYLNGK